MNVRICVFIFRSLGCALRRKFANSEAMFRSSEVKTLVDLDLGLNIPTILFRANVLTNSAALCHQPNLSNQSSVTCTFIYLALSTKYPSVYHTL